MTSVELHLHYAASPTETVSSALAKVGEVYGIRRLSFDRAASILTVEFDATRLNAATVTRLVRLAGLKIDPNPLPSTSQEPACTPASLA